VRFNRSGFIDAYNGNYAQVGSDNVCSFNLPLGGN
jgi:hypothetical protein